MFKGYGKVEEDNNHNNHLEDQQHRTHRKPSKPLIATVSIFAILFLTLTLAFALAALIHHTNNEPPESAESTNSALSATESIRVVCNVTRFPNSCFTSISSSLNTTTITTTIDPESILKLSLRVSIHELATLASSLSASNAAGPAVADCREQVEDAVSRLNESLSAVQAVAAGGGGKGLTEAKIVDVQTWVSAAVTDQQTCLDGLEEMGSKDAAEVKRKMERCGEYTSNSLAIVANIKTLMEKFHMPRH